MGGIGQAVLGRGCVGSVAPLGLESVCWNWFRWLKPPAIVLCPFGTV